MGSDLRTETDIKAEITKALKQMGFEVFRVHCGRVKVRGGWMQFNNEGTFDLFVPVLLNGMAPALLWIDTKQLGAGLRKKQAEFADARPKGQYAIKADSLDEVLEWLKKHQARA